MKPSPRRGVRRFEVASADVLRSSRPFAFSARVAPSRIGQVRVVLSRALDAYDRSSFSGRVISSTSAAFAGFPA